MKKSFKILVVTIMVVAPAVCALLLVLLVSNLMGMLFIVPAVFNLYYSLGMVEPDECIYREILAK